LTPNDDRDAIAQFNFDCAVLSGLFGLVQYCGNCFKAFSPMHTSQQTQIFTACWQHGKQETTDANSGKQ